MLKSYYDLVRFDHAVMIGLGVLIGEIIYLGGFPEPNLTIYLSIILPMLVEMGAFALNDYLDRESDRINNRVDRPLVRGDISERAVIRLIMFAYVVSVGVGMFILPDTAAYVLLGFAVLSILYNTILKHYPLIGNIYIGSCMGIPFIFGNLVLSEVIHPSNISLFLIGVVFGTAREILKDIQDMKGDAKMGSRTLPIAVGVKPSMYISILLILLFIPLSVYTVVNLSPGMLSTIVLGVAELLVLYSIYLVINKNWKKTRNITLLVMFIGLISVVLSVFHI